MYRPLPDGLTIKNSPIEGLGLFATVNIKKNSFIGVTHIRDEQFENKYIRTPLGGFYNHSNDPTVIRMVSDVLPKLKFGDPVDPHANAKKLKDGKYANFDAFERDMVLVGTNCLHFNNDPDKQSGYRDTAVIYLEKFIKLKKQYLSLRKLMF